jgi:DNA-directed RNA polymerase I and III subunit RPAC2
MIEPVTALEALNKGFNDLIDLCDVVAEKFTLAREEHIKATTV